MEQLQQNLYITYSNQRARDLKASGSLRPLDRVTTLDQLITELFEIDHFEIAIDATLGASIVYHTIQTHKVEYFSYLDEDAESLNVIYDFILKCHRNDVAFSQILSGEKLSSIETIDRHYEAYKAQHSLADTADMERVVLENWDASCFDKYDAVWIDDFTIGDISFIKSKKQSGIFEKLAGYPRVPNESPVNSKAMQIKPESEVFDAIDEVKMALKIVRKLLDEGVDADDILIVASEIAEYAPLYKLFLPEYGLRGYSSVGTPLSSFHSFDSPAVARAYDQYKALVQRTESLYNHLGLPLSEKSREAMKDTVKVLDEKIGIEMTEPNQLLGLSRRYGHIIFIGTDINHFPPPSKDNFLYSYDDDLNYFYANSYFNSSLTQYDELKRLCDRLYIVTASYSGKRELTLSIAIENRFDDTIDLSGIRSISELALHGQTVIPEEDTKAYYESITSENLTRFDGMGVEGTKAKHLSASQINKYLSCPLAYLYSNKVRIKAPDQKDEGFDVMQQGSLMHLCYELFGRRIKETGNRSTDKEELYRLMYDISIEAYHDPKTVANRENGENIHHRIFLSTLQAGLIDERDAGLLARFVSWIITSIRQKSSNIFNIPNLKKSSHWMMC